MNVFKIKDSHRKLISLLVEKVPKSRIAIIMQCSSQNVHKMVKILEKHDFLAYTTVGKRKNYLPTIKGVEELNKFKNPMGSSQKVDESEKGIRLHLWFSIDILEKPPNWNEWKEKVLKDYSFNYTTNSASNSKYFDYEDVRIRITPHKVCIRPPDIWASNPEDAKNTATGYLFDTENGMIPRIEHMFKIKLAKPRKANIKVSQQHFAFTKNAIAKWYLERGIKCVIYDIEDHKERLRVDDSHGLKELELVHPRHAEEDAERLNKFLEDTITGKFDHRFVQNSMSIIVDTQERYAEAIEKHLAAVNEIKIAAIRLPDAVAASVSSALERFMNKSNNKLSLTDIDKTKKHEKSCKEQRTLWWYTKGQAQELKGYGKNSSAFAGLNNRNE